MAPEQPGAKAITLYDIASAPPRRTFAPNPWKARLALNFKCASYSTTWVELPDVTATRKALGVPASRKFSDGSDFHTLPVIHDKELDRFVGDSFDIALYLDEKYPERPRLIADGTAGITKAWNDRIDKLFTGVIQLGFDNMPFNPENIDAVREIFVNRGKKLNLYRPDGQLMQWEDFRATGDYRKKLWADFQDALGELESYYSYPSGASKGPFLAGEQLTYADIIVGGWLGNLHETLPPAEWAELETWHNGRWGNIWRALGKYASNTE